MKLDTELVHPGVGRPLPSLAQPAVPGSLVHGVLSAASSVAGSAGRALAAHGLTVREHALLSRLAAGREYGVDTSDVALLSLGERGLVRHLGGSSRSAASVELTPAGERQLAHADAALHQIEARMHSHLATWGPLAVQQMLIELTASTSTSDVPSVTLDRCTGGVTR